MGGLIVFTGVGAMLSGGELGREEGWLDMREISEVDVKLSNSDLNEALQIVNCRGRNTIISEFRILDCQSEPRKIGTPTWAR